MISKLKEMTLQELQALARKEQIKGVSQLKKKQLIYEIMKHEAKRKGCFLNRVSWK